MTWSEYNRELVKRGEFLVSREEIVRWKGKEEKNNRKRGAPFIYHDGLISFMFRIKTIFRFPYRQAEGLTRSISMLCSKNCGIGFLVPDYSTLQRRVRAMKLKMRVFGARNEDAIAVDSSGLTPSNQGQYRRGGKKKGFIKIHIAVNIRSGEVVALSVTDDKVTDREVAVKLMDRAVKHTNIKVFIGDGGYDYVNVYEGAKKRCILPIIRTRIDAKLGKHELRDKLIKARDSHYFKLLYGKRWHAEGLFSRFKRTFGESVFSKDPRMIENELDMKVSILNEWINRVTPVISTG